MQIYYTTQDPPRSNRINRNQMMTPSPRTLRWSPRVLVCTAVVCAVASVSRWLNAGLPLYHLCTQLHMAWALWLITRTSRAINNSKCGRFHNYQCPYLRSNRASPPIALKTFDWRCQASHSIPCYPSEKESIHHETSSGTETAIWSKSALCSSLTFIRSGAMITMRCSKLPFSQFRRVTILRLIK